MDDDIFKLVEIILFALACPFVLPFIEIEGEADE